MSRRSSRRISSAWVLFVSACAASRSHPVEPRPAAPVAPRATRTSVEARSDPGGASSAGIGTPAACERDARARLEAGLADAAFAQLSRCADREDFVELRPLLREPWIGALRARGEEAVRLLVRVAARSGETLAVELGLLRDAGIDVRSLKGAEQAPRAYRDKLVVLRGRLEARREGRERSLVGVELVPMTKEELSLRGRRSGWYDEQRYGWSHQPSGRELVLTGDPRDCAVGGRGLQLLLVRVRELELEPASDDDEGYEPSARPKLRGRAHILDCQPDLVTPTEGNDSKKFLLTRDR
ncbi:hypothetical protein L6R52_33080 [Myxococcota bacterium]|nr:hypothetical protein [Myxococcota bacterium]